VTFCSKCGARLESSPNGSSVSHDIRTSREAILLAGARCTATRTPFAIRFEQGHSGIWRACAAFAISERQLCNPAFSSDQVTSSASLSPSYAGCPHCGADPRKNFAGGSFIKCSCGKLACSPGILGRRPNARGAIVSALLQDTVPSRFSGSRDRDARSFGQSPDDSLAWEPYHRRLRNAAAVAIVV
jgi:hypothetical protein